MHASILTVYYFCGSRLQFCTCDFHWNVQGWCKALVLWNFVLTAALGVQRLAILIGLDGLLPGEPHGHEIIHTWNICHAMRMQSDHAELNTQIV